MYFECVPHVSATDNNADFIIYIYVRFQLKTNSFKDRKKNTTVNCSVAMVLEGKFDFRI